VHSKKTDTRRQQYGSSSFQTWQNIGADKTIGNSFFEYDRSIDEKK
jgi:hypothetical protein